MTATIVGNAKYFGGGMEITPSGDPFSGKLEVRKHGRDTQNGGVSNLVFSYVVRDTFRTSTSHTIEKF